MQAQILHQICANETMKNRNQSARILQAHDKRNHEEQMKPRQDHTKVPMKNKFCTKSRRTKVGVHLEESLKPINLVCGREGGTRTHICPKELEYIKKSLNLSLKK